jgi:cobalt/nickel transport system permease protein
MIVLSSTTRFDALLKGLEKLGVPSLFIMLLSFMYRYVFVLTDEAMRMQRARDSRYCGVAPKGRIKVLANIIGTLFIRTYERGEQVYKSMAGRGFDGEIKTLNLMEYSMRDVVFSGIFAGSVIVIKIWIRG